MRGRYRQYTTHMQRANAMVERTNVNPSNNLHIIDDINMEFLIRSQTIHERWYALHVGTKCCEFEDKVFICKTLLAVRRLEEEEFTYLKHILPTKKDGFLK